MKKQKNRKKTQSEPVSLFCLNSTGAPLARRRRNPVLERLAQSFALVMLVVFPLLIGPGFYTNITVTKFTLFAVFTVVYVLLCALLMMLTWQERHGKTGEVEKLRLTAPQVILMAYVLWATLSAIVSPYRGLWLGQSRYEGLFSIILYGAVFLLLSFWGEYTDGYAYGLGVMGTVAGFFALTQSLGSTLFFFDGDYWQYHFLTTIGHEDCVACLVCILVPALLCGFVLLQDKGRYWGLPAVFFMTYIAVFTDVDTAKLGFLVVLLLLPCLVESRQRLQRLLIGLIPLVLGAACAFLNPRSRAAAPHYGVVICLALAAVLGLAAWLMSRRERVWTVKPAIVRRVGYLLMLVVLLIALVVVYGYQGGNRLVQEASELLHGHLSDEAGTVRGYIWKKTAVIIGEHPVFGGGTGSFATLFQPYNEGYQAVTHNQDVVDFPHNDFLMVAACTGLVGLGLYLAFLITLALRCLKAARRSPVLLIFLAGMAGYLVYSAFVFSIAIVSPLFWVLAGLADKCVRQTQSSDNSQ